MKKIIFVAIAVVILGTAGVIWAATIRVKTDVMFELNTLAINKIIASDLARFDFETKNINPIIDHWKLRVWCNEGIKVGFDAKGVNNCGQSINLTTDQIEKFSLILDRSANNKVDFSFKLKAYDKNGKWLKSEREAFLW